MSEFLKQDLHDPNQETNNSLISLINGEDGTAVDIAAARILAENRDVLEAAMSIAGDTVSSSVESLQESYKKRLIERVMKFMGEEGRGLDRVLGDLNSVISTLPRESSWENREGLMATIDDLRSLAAEYNSGPFVPGKLPLTPKHINDLIRLRVLTYETIRQLLPAIHHYGALMNYGQSLAPAIGLMEFYCNLYTGAFLEGFTLEIQKANHLPEFKARRVVRHMSPDILVQLSEAALRHDLEIKSMADIYKIVSLCQSDLWAMALDENDPAKKGKMGLLVQALICILREMPPHADSLELGLEEPDTELDEDGLPREIDQKEIIWDDEEDGGDENSWEGDPDSWRK